MYIESTFIEQREEFARVYLRGVDGEIDARVSRHGDLWKACITMTTWSTNDTDPRQCVNIGHAYDGEREKVAQWITKRLLDQLKKMGYHSV